MIAMSLRTDLKTWCFKLWNCSFLLLKCPLGRRRTWYNNANRNAACLKQFAYAAWHDTKRRRRSQRPIVLYYLRWDPECHFQVLQKDHWQAEVKAPWPIWRAIEVLCFWEPCFLVWSGTGQQCERLSSFFG